MGVKEPGVQVYLFQLKDCVLGHDAVLLGNQF
jgi:hypothetical protein